MHSWLMSSCVACCVGLEPLEALCALGGNIDCAQTIALGCCLSEQRSIMKDPVVAANFDVYISSDHMSHARKQVIPDKWRCTRIAAVRLLSSVVFCLLALILCQHLTELHEWEGSSMRSPFPLR
ncbi:hypothetical protein EDD21DRAFT_110361 [Dissophora ornata]|nr:hypothetical protein EDD21DRAFT_110361 [Dissophora ornata]